MSKGSKGRKKLKSKAGFTMAEMLVAILILLMASSIMVAGIPAAKNAYEGVVEVSNAELLLSTTISTLRNELGTAKDLGAEGSDAIVYYNENREAFSKIFIGPYKYDDTNTTVNTIMFQRYASADLNKESGTVRLISKEASTDHLYATYDSLDWDEEKGVITIEGLSVDKPGKTGIAGRDSVSFRVMSYGVE